MPAGGGSLPKPTHLVDCRILSGKSHPEEVTGVTAQHVWIAASCLQVILDDALVERGHFLRGLLRLI